MMNTPTIKDLLKRTSLGSLSHIPLHYVVSTLISFGACWTEANDLLLKSDLPEQIDSPTTASTQGSNDEHLDVGSSTFGSLKPRSHMVDHGLLIGVWLQGAQTSSSSLFLSSKRQSTRCGTRKTSVETKRCHSATCHRVFKELEIVKSALPLREASQNVVPARLLFVAMSKLDMSMGKRITCVLDTPLKDGV
jgi:hypothetical protein